MKNPRIFPAYQREVRDFLRLRPQLIYHAIVFKGTDIISDSPNATPHDVANLVRDLIMLSAATWNRGVYFTIVALRAFNGSVLILPTNTIFPDSAMEDEFITDCDIDYDLTFPAILLTKED